MTGLANIFLSLFVVEVKILKEKRAEPVTPTKGFFFLLMKYFYLMYFFFFYYYIVLLQQYCGLNISIRTKGVVYFYKVFFGDIYSLIFFIGEAPLEERTRAKPSQKGADQLETKSVQSKKGNPDIIHPRSKSYNYP